MTSTVFVPRFWRDHQDPPPSPVAAPSRSRLNRKAPVWRLPVLRALSASAMRSCNSAILDAGLGGGVEVALVYGLIAALFQTADQGQDFGALHLIEGMELG